MKKHVDKATPKLMEACAKGNSRDEATLWFHRPGADPHDWMSIKLTNVVVSSYSSSGSEGERPVEELSFNYEKFELRYNEKLLDGSSTPHEFRWDLRAAKPF